MVFSLWLVSLLFLTNLYLTTHNHGIGHSNTNSVPACAVFCLGRVVPASQAPSERTRKCPKALDVSLKLADFSAANPYWGSGHVPSINSPAFSCISSSSSGLVFSFVLRRQFPRHPSRPKPQSVFLSNFSCLCAFCPSVYCLFGVKPSF